MKVDLGILFYFSLKAFDRKPKITTCTKFVDFENRPEKLCDSINSFDTVEFGRAPMARVKTIYFNFYAWFRLYVECIGRAQAKFRGFLCYKMA